MISRTHLSIVGLAAVYVDRFLSPSPPLAFARYELPSSGYLEDDTLDLLLPVDIHQNTNYHTSGLGMMHQLSRAVERN